MSDKSNPSKTSKGSHRGDLEPFKARLRDGPATTADVRWALEEAEELVTAAAATLRRLHREDDATGLIDALEAIRRARRSSGRP